MWTKWLKGLLGFVVGALAGGALSYALVRAQYFDPKLLKNAPDAISLIVIVAVGLMIVLSVALVCGIIGAVLSVRHL